MWPLLIGAVLWQAPAAIDVPPGAVQRLSVPPVARPAHLVFRALLPSSRPAGSLPALRVTLNGTAVGPM